MFAIRKVSVQAFYGLIPENESVFLGRIFVWTSEDYCIDKNVHMRPKLSMALTLIYSKVASIIVERYPTQSVKNTPPWGQGSVFKTFHF